MLPFSVRLPLPPTLNKSSTPFAGRLVLTKEARRGIDVETVIRFLERAE